MQNWIGVVVIASCGTLVSPHPAAAHLTANGISRRIIPPAAMSVTGMTMPTNPAR